MWIGVHAQQYQVAPIERLDPLTQINQFIGAGRCGEAEALARNTVRPPLLHTILGLVELDCRKNRQAAINFLKLAAEQRETVAIETLNTLGVQVTATSRYDVPSVRSVDPDPALPPPPHTMSPLPQPRQRVIVVPPPIVVVPNPNACIQDGGTIYCRR
jgi:hypothetical protein